MLFSYAIEGFLGWLSRFKLIRLRRISLATLRRDGWRDGRRDGQRDGCQYMYCLPPAGVLHSQNKVINAPPTASQSWMGRGMGGGMGRGIANDMYNNDVGKGVVYAYEAYEVK